MFPRTYFLKAVCTLVPTVNCTANACLSTIKSTGCADKRKEKHPDKRVMLVADKGTMGVGSSRMSGVNNVALWTGIQASPYVPFINIAPIVGGTNGISPIFLTTVGRYWRIGVDLKNWVKKTDANGETVLDEDGEPILEQVFSIDTGTVLTINTKTKNFITKMERKNCAISQRRLRHKNSSSFARRALMPLSLVKSCRRPQQES